MHLIECEQFALEKFSPSLIAKSVYAFSTSRWNFSHCLARARRFSRRKSADCKSGAVRTVITLGVSYARVSLKCFA